MVILLTGLAVWKLRKRAGVAGSEEENAQRQERTKMIICFVMLVTGALDILVYSLSSAPSTLPGQHARYLIGLLISLPTVLAPIWDGANALQQSLTRNERVWAMACRGILAFIFLAFLAGTIYTFTWVPAAMTTYQQDEALVHDLEHIGVKHMYAEFWTCNRSAFLSDEQITCAVVNTDLTVDWFHSRYKPYIPLVEHDPHSAYVCPMFLSYVSSEVANLEKKADAPGSHYKKYVFEGYLVLVPSS